VDNNPNFNPLIYTENTSKMHFEFPDWNNEKMKVQEDSVGKSYAVQPCTFGPSEHSLGDEGSDAFYFIPSSSAECFGAPYSIFTNQLPVRAAADPDKLFMRSGTERGNSTPYMAPNHVGDMYYDMEFTVTTAKGSETMGGNIDIPGYGAKDIKKELYSKLFKFSITDNDPPQIAVESQTSFTEKKQFNISFTDIPFVHGNFNSPGVFESAFDTALKSADPTGWPAGIVDSAPTVVTSGTSEAYFGPGLLSVDTNAESRKVPNATEATGDLRTASVTLIRGRDPKYMVYIPENSRAVFRIQACDNVPVSKGNYQMKIDWSNNGNFTSEVEAINGGAKTDAMNKFLEDIAIAIDPKDPNIVNLYGTFRTPMKAGEEGALKLVVTDAAGNSREIDVPFQVVDTFIKKDRLDLERQRTNQ
jgi:hypothetical protein